MRALLIAIVLSGVGDNVWAEAANQRVTAFDPCFQIAGAAAAICGDPRNGAAERLDCQKTRERRVGRPGFPEAAGEVGPMLRARRQIRPPGNARGHWLARDALGPNYAGVA